MNAKCALVMAGGTGGHIFPGLAVAEALRDAGWRVHWLGAPDSMESQLVPQRGFAFEPVAFGGVRGKGLVTLAVLPLKLLRAFWQSLQVMRRVRGESSECHSAGSVPKRARNRSSHCAESAISGSSTKACRPA